MILAKIDVTKIDKARLYIGKQGKYLDIALIPSQNDKYDNDYMIVQSVSKEEREAGKRGPIIGNAKILASRQESRRPTQTAPTTTAKPEPPDDGHDDVPF